VTHVVKVFAPSCVSIKMKQLCKDGAKHLFKTIYSSRYLSKELRDIVDPAIQRNSFFGHHDILLLAMISDERKRIRELGLRQVLKARMTKCKSIREFVTPERTKL